VKPENLTGFKNLLGLNRKPKQRHSFWWYHYSISQSK